MSQQPRRLSSLLPGRLPAEYAAGFEGECAYGNFLRIRAALSGLALWAACLLAAYLWQRAHHTEPAGWDIYHLLDLILAAFLAPLLATAWLLRPADAGSVGNLHRALALIGVVGILAWSALVSAVEQVVTGGMPTLIIASCAVATLPTYPGRLSALIYLVGLGAWAGAACHLGADPGLLLTRDVATPGLLYASWIVSVVLFHTRAQVYADKRRLGEANAELAQVAADHRDARRELEDLTGVLELRVHSRTAELRDANEQLRRQVAERERAERRLAEREAIYRALVEHSPDAFLRFDRGLRVAYASPASKGLLGLAPSAMQGATLEACGFEPAAGEEWTGWVREVLDAGRGLHRELRLTLADGPVALDVRLIPEADAEGATVSVLSVVRDVTGLRHAEESQRLASIGQLSAGVAHEFNNLLTAMALSADMARSSGSAESYHRLAELVSEISGRGAELCRNLMAYTRPVAPRHSETRLDEVWESALALVSQQLASAGIAVRRQYEQPARALPIDRGQLEQVFLNLLINACHAMPQGGVLTVGTRHDAPEPGHLTAFVSDTGVGIPPENLARIFEPFFTTKDGEGTGGTGLGLSVSRQLVEAHGGTLRVTSEVECGATFEVTLPPVAPELAPPPSEPATLEPDLTWPALAGRLILVADDERMLRELMADMLTEAGCRVLLADDATSAVDLLRTQPFDAVLSDVMMPGGGGREVLAEVAAMDDPPPTILMTGRLEVHIAEDLLSLGASRCLTKPFSRAALLRAIEELVGETAPKGVL